MSGVTTIQSAHADAFLSAVADDLLARKGGNFPRNAPFVLWKGRGLDGLVLDVRPTAGSDGATHSVGTSWRKRPIGTARVRITR